MTVKLGNSPTCFKFFLTIIIRNMSCYGGFGGWRGAGWGCGVPAWGCGVPAWGVGLGCGPCGFGGFGGFGGCSYGFGYGFNSGCGFGGGWC